MKKKYLIKPINFGKKGDISREIVEELIRKTGKVGLSKEIRNSVIAYFSTNKQFNQMKINFLLEKRKQLKKQIPKISKELLGMEKALNKLGYKLKDLE